MNCPKCNMPLNIHTQETWSLWPGWICGCGAVLTAEKMDGSPELTQATPNEITDKRTNRPCSKKEIL